MPDSGPNSHHVNNGKPVQSINPRQSSWLTHWTGTRLETSKHDHLTQLSKSERYDHDIKKHPTGVEIASDNFGYSKVIEDVDLTMSLKQQSNESFPFFKRGLESGKCALLNEGVQALGPQVSHKNFTTDFNVEASSSELHLKPERASQIPTEQVKYHMFFGESSLDSRPSDQGAYKPNSHTIHGPENFSHLTAAFASKDHFQKSEKSEVPSFLGQDKAAHLKTDPSTSSQHVPLFIKEPYKRMQKHSGMGFFPHQSGSPQHTKSQTLHHGQCSFQNIPHFVHDLEMTRMSSGLHSFSRTTHSLLITKQTDVKVYQESQIFRESRVSTHLKEETLRELNCSPPHYAQGQQGVKLQLLDSSDHESQQNVEEYKASGDVEKNESSADTDAMDMEAFKENQLDDLDVLLPKKNIMVESNIRILPRVTLSTQKDTPRKRKIELPDMNLEVSALPATSSSTEKAEPCPSRTQSLDMNTLHFNVDQTSNSNSNECSNSNFSSEPGSRWIKRLKLAETSSHGKLDRFLTRVLGGNKPEPATSDKDHGKRSESLTGKVHHKSSEIQIGETSSEEIKQECKDVTLSHCWIRRWSHKQNQKSPDTSETCKLENSKVATDEFEKKQFPSIAAMALMGKAMSGFQQCKFQKKESFVVWNTKAFD